MPISSDFGGRNFIIKITNYKKIINVPNSFTVLDDLLPIAIEMTLKNCRGNYNFVNPGTLSHNEIMDLYIKHINPKFKYENFTVEEQSKILKAGRSNCELNPEKLLKIFPSIPHVKDSIIHIFNKLKNAKQNER